MPARRTVVVSFDIGKKNMGITHGYREGRQLLHMRRMALPPGKNLAERVGRLVAALPRPDTVLIEQQVPMNMTARSIELELYRAYGRRRSVQTLPVDPSLMRSYFGLRKGKRAKKTSAVEKAAALLADRGAVRMSTAGAAASYRAFLDDPKGDDYADSLLQFLWYCETSGTTDVSID